MNTTETMKCNKIVNVHSSEVDNHIVLTKLSFNTGAGKENFTQENYISREDGQELEKYKINIWRDFLSEKLVVNKNYNIQTENLDVFYSFGPDTKGACKHLLMLDEDASNGGNHKVHEKVLHITYTRKQDTNVLIPSKCDVIQDLNIASKSSKTKPLRARNKKVVENNEFKADITEEKQSQLIEKRALRKRSVKEAEAPQMILKSTDDQIETKKAKGKSTKTASSLSLTSHAGKRQTTLENFFQKSPPAVSNIRKSTAQRKQKLGREDKEDCTISGVPTNINCMSPIEETTPTKIEEPVDYPITPNFDKSLSVIANLENLAKNLRTPVKSSTVFAHYDPKEDEGLDKFVYPDDDEYTADCATLKKAFDSGLIEEVDSKIATRMFERNLSFLKAIESGELYSIRHAEYHSDIQKRRTMDYAPGCIIFGEKNLSLFMELMGNHLTEDNEDHRNKIPYFMLVLVPELITKIVMGVYDINKQEAVNKKKEIGILVTKNTPLLF